MLFIHMQIYDYEDLTEIAESVTFIENAFSKRFQNGNGYPRVRYPFCFA
jgi:hypothetical protein